MEMLLNAMVCLMVSCTNAIYVRRIEGRVNLPMVSVSSCGHSCPKPTRTSGTSVNFLREVSTMTCNWRENVPYIFNHVELVDSRRQFFRVFNGSQTSCDRYPDGTYSCTPQPGHYCYAHVRLGYRTRRNSMVSIHLPSRNIPPTLYNGAETVPIYSFGTHLQRPTVRFELECSGDNPCLEDRVTLISLQYRCTHQQPSF
ncbi:uncharacterized protein LOC123534974 [Mercenaria mercenaria]|uniref:uncharacterized protein LOC123534974 n=1 Tax=Mercenaria mercenaria TaxID=6596 RepID=UPI00234EBD4A|nr:uncharacterized protein LOC123534974 [Mercenaria mercenaria]